HTDQQRGRASRGVVTQPRSPAARLWIRGSYIRAQRWIHWFGLGHCTASQLAHSLLLWWGGSPTRLDGPKTGPHTLKRPRLCRDGWLMRMMTIPTRTDRQSWRIPPTMTVAPVLPSQSEQGGVREARLLLGLALTSFAGLLLELALTRLFSVVLFYHFAFLAISLALLGLGAGGVFAYLRRNWLAHWDLRRLAGVICALNAAAVMTALWVVLHVPVSLSLRPMNILRLTAIYLATGVPFFFTGLLFSVVFARASRWVTQLYGTDLIGGALACLAVVPLLNWLGGPNAVVCAALVMAMAAAIWAGTGTQHKIAIGMAAVLVMLVAANHSERFIDVVYAKGMRNVQPWVEFARWNTISRVEVDDSGEGNGKWIRIDSDAATVIMNSDPHNPASSSYLEQLARSP